MWYLEFYRYHGKFTACDSVGTAGMCARLFAKRGMGRHGARYVRLCACGGMLEVIPVQRVWNRWLWSVANCCVHGVGGIGALRVVVYVCERLAACCL